MLLKHSTRLPAGHFKKYIDDDSIVPTEVVLLNYQEWEYTSIGVDPTFEELVDYVNKHNSSLTKSTRSYVNKHNSSLTIINGSVESSALLYDNTNERYKNIKSVIYWSTYFLSTWYYKCKRETNTSHLSEDELIKEYNQEFNYLYMSLNNKPHFHRCLQFDLLAKSDLLKDGAVTWNSWFSAEGRKLETSFYYPFKYWNPELLILDDTDIYWGWGTKLPKEIKNSFMQLVNESAGHIIIFSEKLVFPLFFNKLFLVSGAVNYHKELQKLGFVLYDDVFDYSFDSEPDMETRYTMITANLERLRGYSKEKLNELYTLSLSKMEHNKRNLITISSQTKFIPNYIVDLCENNPNFINDMDCYHFYKFIKSVEEEKSDEKNSNHWSA